MPDPIESSVALREHLGEHLNLIKAMDPLPRQRSLTGSFRKKLIDVYGMACAYCLRRGQVEAAHIIPLEIGAETTQQNLVLLCRTCHQLYDAGYMSIANMSEIGADWRMWRSPSSPRRPLGTSRPPQASISEAPKSVSAFADAINQMRRERRYVKAARLIVRLLSEQKTDDPGRIWLLIKQAELTRRRSARGVVSLALDALSQIDPAKVPRECQSVFFYELTYVHRLLGNHAVAARFALESARAQDKAEVGYAGVDYVAAMAMETLCRLAQYERLNTRQAARFESDLGKLEVIARKHGEYWGGRWAINCAATRLQVRIKAQDGTGARKTLKGLRDMYYHWDLSSGWDAAGRQTLSQLDGLVSVMFPRNRDDVQKGIGLLSRSFLTRLGSRQRPEGVRDVGFGLAIGLRALGSRQRKIADSLECLMERTVDGTSVIWPWHAV